MKKHKLSSPSAMLFIGAFLTVVVLTGIIIARKSPSTPKEAIVQNLQKAQNAINREDIDGFLVYMGEDFKDNRGHSKEQLKVELQKWKSIYRDFNTEIKHHEITFESESLVRSDLEIVLNAGSHILKMPTYTMNMKIQWHKKDYVWMMQSAQWEVKSSPNP